MRKRKARNKNKEKSGETATAGKNVKRLTENKTKIPNIISLATFS